MKKIISLLVFLALNTCFASPDEQGASRHSLVDIFCTALIEQGPKDNASKNLDEVWPDLEKHLESGKLYSSLLSIEQLESSLETLKNTPLFKKCFEENSKDLEYGEFILNGKRNIQDTLIAYQKNSTVSLSSASFQLNEGGTLPGDLSLNISSGETGFDNPKIIEVINQREKKYQSMWHRFIADLKTKSKGLHF